MAKGFLVKRFEPIYGESDVLNRTQDNIQEALGHLASLEILDGRLVSNRVQDELKESLDSLTVREIIDGRLISESIGTSGVLVAHGLGRPYKGVLVVKTSLPDGTDFTGRVREISTAGHNPDPSIYVKMASTAGTPDVSLWVF